MGAIVSFVGGFVFGFFLTQFIFFHREPDNLIFAFLGLGLIVVSRYF